MTQLSNGAAKTFATRSGHRHPSSIVAPLSPSFKKNVAHLQTWEKAFRHHKEGKINLLPRVDLPLHTPLLRHCNPVNAPHLGRQTQAANNSHVQRQMWIRTRGVARVMQDIRCQTYGASYLMSDTWCQTSYVRHLVPEILCQTSGARQETMHWHKLVHSRCGQERSHKTYEPGSRRTNRLKPLSALSGVHYPSLFEDPWTSERLPPWSQTNRHRRQLAGKHRGGLYNGSQPDNRACSCLNCEHTPTKCASACQHKNHTY